MNVGARVMTAPRMAALEYFDVNVHGCEPVPMNSMVVRGGANVGWLLVLV
jgi:hypothetical protein